MINRQKDISFFTKIKNFLMFDDRVNTRRKTYASLWAIVIGFMSASIIYWLMTLNGKNPVNPFTFIINLFKFALDSSENTRNKLYGYFLVFAFAGLAVAIAFKSGLFNIGISGQMQLPGALFFLFLILSRSRFDNVSTTYFLGMFVVFFLVSMLLGALSGFLKAFFNVHEVISTIFLNWIITYIGVWLFTRGNYTLVTPDDPLLTVYMASDKGTNKILLSSDVIQLFLILGFVVLLLFSFGLWFIYSNTTIGYKLKMVGLNKTNAKYVGINEKLLTIIVMGLSGGLAGLAGFYYFVFLQGSYSAENYPILIGFESIAIALVALNSPIGVLFTSFLYAVIYNGQTRFQLLKGSQKITPEFFSIINGIIIFMAALAIMFYNFKPLRNTAKYAFLATKKKYWEYKKKLFKEYWTVILEEKMHVQKLFFENIKLKSQFRKKEVEYHNYVLEKMSLIKNSKDKTDSEILAIYDEISKKKFEFLKARSDFGLNRYSDEKNKLKNKLYTRKISFTNFKEEEFTKWTKTLFKKETKLVKGEK